ncbi:MAG: DNA polymerase III subunit delta' [Bdellovibrio bacteriovorus]
MPEHLIPMDAPLPPWLEGSWGRLGQARAANRLAHALLISGPRGIGKRRLVERLVRGLLCPSPGPDGSACGECPDCRLVRAGSHPDLVRVGPDPDSKSGDIAIESIRQLGERTALTAGRGGRVLVVIDPADRMNTAAANALLKTLEEPPGPVLLCLIAEHPGRLPATIRSRCQQLSHGIPPREQALRWLESQGPRGQTDDAAAAMRLALARGAPLRAVGEIDSGLLEQHARLRASLVALARGELDPVTEAAAWNGLGARLSLDWLAGWLCDLLRLAAVGADAKLDDVAAGTALAELAPRVDQGRAHRLLHRVFQASGLTDSTVNPHLLLESLLVEWRRLFGG